jgi:hypothetical protein
MNLTKPRLDQFKVTGTTVGDVYFPETKLLLPFDGTNGATATDDLSNLNNTATFGGNASISTARSKFGGSSCHFDGTGDYVDIGGTYWTTGAAIDSGDFTIEFWLNIDAWGGDASQCLITNYGTNSGGWAFYASNSTHQSRWWHHNGSGWVYLNNSTGTRTALSLDTWYHIALTRSGNIFRLFLDGTQEDSMTDSNAMTSSNGGSHSGIRMGGINAGVDYPVNGYIDDVRITKGVARYTSNFTAPTTAHLTSAGDANKQILVNSTADGVVIGRGGINQSRIAKAWVSFNGIPSTLDILDSYNISSVTDHGTGNYEVIFATAMSDANYSQVISSTGAGTHSGYGIYSTLDRSTTGQTADDSTTTSFGIANARYGYGTRYDCSRITAVIFGN